VLAESGLFLHQSRTFPLLKHPEEISRFLADGILLRIILGVIAAVLLIGIGLIAGRTPEIKGLIVFFAFAVFLNNVMGGFSSFLYGNERFGLFGLLSSGTQIVATALGILALYLGWGMSGIGAAQAVTAILAIIIIGGIVSGKFCQPAAYEFSARLFDLFKKSLPLATVTILVIFYNRANFALVSFISGDEAAGYYNAAFALMNGCLILATTIGSVFLPRLAGLYNQDRETLGNLYRTAYRYLVFLGIGMAAGTMMVADPLVKMLYSGKYAPAAEPLLLLIWVAALMFPNALGQALLIARHANRPLVKMIAMAAILNIILCGSLIPRFGYMGAAMAMLVGEIFLWLYGFVLNREYLPPKQLFNYLWKSILASFIMLAFIRFLPPVQLPLIIIGGGLIYCIILILLRGLSKSDLDILIRAVKG
jgi:O-antigen/teichoic acid export membrane protein